MLRETIEIFLKRNKPVNFYKFFDNALFIWNEKIQNRTDYNFDFALTYDCIKCLGRMKNSIFFGIDSENKNRIYLKLKEPIKDIKPFSIEEMKIDKLLENEVKK